MHGKAGERDGSQGRSRVHTNPRAPGHVLFLLMTAPQSLVARKVNASNDSSSAVPWGYNQRFPDPENGLLPLSFAEGCSSSSLASALLVGIGMEMNPFWPSES